MIHYLFFALFGYFSGSILYADRISRLFCDKDIRLESKDGNPGTANVYLTCGFFPGTLCLFLELFKGFFPVYAALHLPFMTCSMESPLFVFVLTAPVLGHAVPFFQRKKGGKAIAVSFGVLLGLFPLLKPAVLLAFFYLLFSLLVVIRPHLFRSVITFFCTSCFVFLTCAIPSVRIGCSLISLIVICKHLQSYDGEKCTLQFFPRR